MDIRHIIDRIDFKAYRSFLEIMWRDAHKQWNPHEIPDIPSQHMCRYTCLFLQEILLKEHELKTEIRTGCPEEILNGTPNGIYGIKDMNGCWHDHSWLITENMIIDLTADQFGFAPVIIMPADPARYNPSPDQSIFDPSFQKLQNRADQWSQIYADRTL